jgi:uroporphyrinogen-III synthase
LLANSQINDKNVLIPCSAIARTELRGGLKKLGAIVDFIPVYNVELPPVEEYSELLTKCRKNMPDIFLFTSPSSFDNFLQIFNVENKDLFFKNKLIAAIGNTTAAAINQKGLKVDILPAKFTLMNTVEEILNYNY